MKPLLRILEFGKPYRHYVPEYLLYTLGYSVFGLFNFAMLIPLLNIIFGIAAPQEVITDPEFSLSLEYIWAKFQFILFFIADEYGKMYTLFFVGAVMIFLNLLANLFRYLSIKTTLRFRVNISKRIRNAIYKKSIEQSMSYHLSKKRGELITTAIQEVSEVENTFVNALRSILADPIMIIIYFSYLFYVSFELSLVTIVFLPIAAFGISSLAKKLRASGEQHLTASENLFSFLEETLSSTRVIQSYVATAFFSKKHNELNERLSLIHKKTNERRDLASPVSELLGVVVIVSILIYGGYLIFRDEGNSGLSPSVFIGYLIIYSQVISPLKSLSNNISYLQRSIIAAKNIIYLLDEPNVIVEKENPVPLNEFNHSIKFSKVSFGYEEKFKALQNLDLVIRKGECVALVGASGSGKTTISYLLNRFIDPNSGDIYIDGVNLKDYKLDDLRKMIAYIPQESLLFHDTIINNVAFGQEQIDKTKFQRSLEVAYAQKFVDKLSQKENTIIGEKGMTLSGGERQRITIARAIYKDAPILVLDEATSALDSESEQFVQKAIDQLVKNKTSIIIAHRLSTIKNADRILVMQKGKIVEEGTHQSLIQIKGGYYQNLVNIQQLS